MTTATLNQTRLTDALERDMLRNAMADQAALRPIAVLGTVGRGIASFARGAIRFATDVGNAMDEARARDARFSGAQW